MQVSASTSPHQFLTGPAGSGKTQYAIETITKWMEGGVPLEKILLMTPQRSYALPYRDAFSTIDWYRLGKATVGGLARRYVSLFWQQAAELGGLDPHRPPQFLTYEVAQYFMSRVVSRLIEQGFQFSERQLPLPRLYSQLLDNLNKAAANNYGQRDPQTGRFDFGLPAITNRLRTGLQKSAQEAIQLEEITHALQDYRDECLKHNLLDFSLYLSLFGALMQEHEAARMHLFGAYTHLVADNIEEDIPLSHRLLKAWRPHLAESRLLFDEDGGYRRFLAANPLSAKALIGPFEEQEMRDRHRSPASLLAWQEALSYMIRGEAMPGASDLTDTPSIEVERLHHAMVDRAIAWVTEKVRAKVPANEIAIISPFLSESLRFALTSGLEAEGIEYHVHRPSRTLRDEPTTQVLLTLAQLAHPQWELQPATEAVAHMLHRVLKEADLVRATLLAGSAFNPNTPGLTLTPFADFPAEMRERITFVVGEQYEVLRKWLTGYREESPFPIDHFYNRLFGELLSQPGFGYYQDVLAGSQVANVAESAQKFRQAVMPVLGDAGIPIGQAYHEMVDQGVISAFYQFDWEGEGKGVLLMPVHTFLLRNRPVAHQLWLDGGSPSWHRRINQPLTNPYILAPEWEEGAIWSAELEQELEIERLDGIVKGLVRRCTASITVLVSELSPHGQDQQGRLLKALSRTARRLRQQRKEED